MNVWDIIEAIDDPSGLIHPEKHQAFASRTHPLANNPAYPDYERKAGERGTNYEEVIASRQWQKILQKAHTYLGVPLTAQALPVIHRKLASALQLIHQSESQYREELEALAVDLVFELPEFKSARQAYESDMLQIDANLTGEMSGMSGGMMTSDEEDEEKPAPAQRTPAEHEWIKKMVQRRHFTNALIQGSAVSNNFLFEMAGKTLDRIHPDLRKAYGVLMVSSEIGYWMFPQDQIIAAAKEKTHIGSSQMEIEQERPVVRANGNCFPVLIQEIIKGLTEVASLPSLPRDPSDREEVIRQADLVDLESWSMILGPKLWDSFIEAVDAENERELTMHLYRHIQSMDVDKFNSFMREVLAKSPAGMKMLRELAAKIKSELAQEREGGDGEIAEAKEIMDHLIDSEDFDSG